MRITQVCPKSHGILSIVAEDGRKGEFDVRPYLADEAFEDLRRPDEFAKVFNGGYFVEWDCGADLSADTIEARWQVIGKDTDRVASSTHETIDMHAHWLSEDKLSISQAHSFAEDIAVPA